MEDTKYQVGDVVKVRSDLIRSKSYPMERSCESGAPGSAFVTESMMKRAGKEVVISKIEEIEGHMMYHIEGGSNNIYWTDGMFEGLVSPVVDIDQSALLDLLL